jgi:hypothetical protein
MVTQPRKAQPPKGDVLRAKQDNSFDWRSKKREGAPGRFWRKMRRTFSTPVHTVALQWQLNGNPVCPLKPC